MSPIRGAKVYATLRHSDRYLCWVTESDEAFTGQLSTGRTGHVTDDAADGNGDDVGDVTWFAAWGEAGCKEVGRANPTVLS